MRLSRGYSALFAAGSIACGTPPLTVVRAAEVLATSPILSGVEKMTFTTARGCFVLESGQPLDGNALDRDPRLSENAELRATLDRERRLDLLDFEFSPTPITSASPPEGCERLWAAYHSVASPGAASAARLVGWRSLMSDKAVAAGLRPGQSFVARQQRLIAVGNIVMRDARTAAADYTWHWAPTFETEHLGIAPSEPVRSTATFTWRGKEWALAP